MISDLAPGLSVTVKETEAPDGYVLDSAPQTIRIRSGMSAQTLTFYNAPKGSVSVRKLDAVTEQPLSGAEFKVTSANGVPLDNDGGKISTNGLYRTDDNGQFLITKVQPGAYVITDVIWYERCLSRQNTHITIAAGHLWRMIALCTRKAAIRAGFALHALTDAPRPNSATRLQL